MNKKITGIIIVLVVVIASAGYYFYQNKGGKSVGIDSTIVNENKKTGNTTLESDKVVVVYFSFNLSKDDIEKIDSLNKDLRVGPDPDNFDF